MLSFAAPRGLFSFRRANNAGPVLDRAIEQASLHKGPPAIAAARAQCRDHPDIVIAPLETRFGMIGDRIAVRAWILVSEVDQAQDLREVTRRSMQAFGGDGRMADVFFLGAAYGIRTADIASLLGLSRWRVRRLFLAALARIHSTFGDYMPTAEPDGSTEPTS